MESLLNSLDKDFISDRPVNFKFQLGKGLFLTGFKETLSGFAHK